MADRAIEQLVTATQVKNDDLFVLQQDTVAKKLTGRTLVLELAKELDGHGGISTVTKASTSGLKDTYRITFVDGSTTTFVVTNGEKGDKGDQTYVHIRYAAKRPTSNSEILTTPSAWIGIYTGLSSSAPANYTSYTWGQFKGDNGDTGNGIRSIDLVSTSGTSDTYRVSFTDGSSTTFNVTNGSNISRIQKTSTQGLTDTYTVTLTNGNTNTFTVTNAKSIVSITTSGNHAAGSTDRYTILFNDGDTAFFDVYNGANGAGAVSTVAGIGVVGASGDVPLIVQGGGAPTTKTVGFVNQIYFDGTNSQLYVCIGIDDANGTYDWRGASVTVDPTLSTSSTNPIQNKAVATALNGKQATLVSGTNIKTVNGNSLLGSGNISITSGVSSVAGKTGAVTLNCADVGLSLSVSGDTLSITTR